MTRLCGKYEAGCSWVGLSSQGRERACQAIANDILTHGLNIPVASATEKWNCMWGADVRRIAQFSVIYSKSFSYRRSEIHRVLNFPKVREKRRTLKFRFQFCYPLLVVPTIRQLFAAAKKSVCGFINEWWMESNISFLMLKYWTYYL